jgi:hypothetical protein
LVYNYYYLIVIIPALPASSKRRLFSFVHLSLERKSLTVRVNRLGYETTIFFDGVKTASVKKSRHRSRRWTRQFDRFRGPVITMVMLMLLLVRMLILMPCPDQRAERRTESKSRAFRRQRARVHVGEPCYKRAFILAIHLLSVFWRTMKGKMQTLLFFRRERIKYRRSLGTGTGMCMKHIIQVVPKRRTHYLLPDRGSLNVPT